MQMVVGISGARLGGLLNPEAFGLHGLSGSNGAMQLTLQRGNLIAHTIRHRLMVPCLFPELLQLHTRGRLVNLQAAELLALGMRLKLKALLLRPIGLALELPLSLKGLFAVPQMPNAVQRLAEEAINVLRIRT